MSIKYSIVIPTLNEEIFLKKNLDSLRTFKRDLEIIVSDGGSTDNTLDVCKGYKVKIINSLKGRGIQLNDGAKEASGNILIFLHADTFLPENAFDLLDKYFEIQKNNICRFLLGFDFNHKLLDFYSSLSKYDTPFTRFGDSVIIVRKSFFEKLTGFNNRDTFEDVDFFNRASKYNRINILTAEVNTSARRLVQNGLIKQQLFSIILYLGYLLSINARTLSRLYNKINSDNLRNSLIIFLRYPRNGEVKTRLAKTTSPELATDIYKIFSENLINIIKRIPNINRFTFYSKESDKEVIMEWLGSKLLFSQQQGDDLGNKMKNAFEKVFSIGTQKVIIVGTDIPDLSKEIIVDAYGALDNHDVVIGPSNDGGYYLIGMKNFYSGIFEEIEYSTPTVLKVTLEKVKQLKLTYHLLPTLRDIDNKEDLLDWISTGKSSSRKSKIKLLYNNYIEN